MERDLDTLIIDKTQIQSLQNNQQITQFILQKISQLQQYKEIRFPENASSNFRRIGHELAKQKGLISKSVEIENSKQLIIFQKVQNIEVLPPDTPRYQILDMQNRISIVLFWELDEELQVQGIEIKVKWNNSEFKQLRYQYRDNNIYVDDELVIRDDNNLTLVCDQNLHISLLLQQRTNEININLEYPQPNTIHKIEYLAFNQSGCSDKQEVLITSLPLSKQLYSWGKNNCNLVSTSSQEIILKPEFNDLSENTSNIVSISGGLNSILGVISDGSLIQWGNYVDNEEEKVTASMISPFILPIYEGVFFSKVSCSDFNFAAITVDGKLYTWGFAENGKLGQGCRCYAKDPTLIESISNKFLIDISLSQEQSLACDINGDLYQWGLCFNPMTTGASEILTPNRISRIGKVVKVNAGRLAGIAITQDGELFTWGNNDYCRIGHKRSRNLVLLPEKLQVSDIVDAKIGAMHLVVLNNQGEVFTVGQNKLGQLGIRTYQDQKKLQKVQGISNITQIAVGQKFTVCLDNLGKVFAFGEGRNGCIGIGKPGKVSKPVQASLDAKITEIVAGVDFCLALA